MGKRKERDSLCGIMKKRLQYPINIKTPNAKLAQFIMSQYGGPECSNLY